MYLNNSSCISLASHYIFKMGAVIRCYENLIYFLRFPLRYITGSILFGALYDKFNRLTLLIISSFIGAVFQCIQPWCSMFPVMLIVRFIASLFSGAMETGQQF